jgi:hypothetical protein
MEKTNCLLIVFHPTLLSDLGYHQSYKKGEYFIYVNMSLPYNKYRRTHVHESVQSGKRAMLFLQTSRDKQDDYILIRPVSSDGFFEGGAEKLNCLDEAAKQRIVSALKQFALA